jgi:uridylate kinase
LAISYRRVLLKLGGESLAGPEGSGIDPDRATQVATKIQGLRNLDLEVAIVLGAATSGAARSA